MTKWVAIVFCCLSSFMSLWAEFDPKDIVDFETAGTMMVAIDAKKASFDTKDGVSYLTLKGVRAESLGVAIGSGEVLRLKTEDVFDRWNTMGSNRGAVIGIDTERTEFPSKRAARVRMEYTVTGVEKLGKDSYMLQLAPASDEAMPSGTLKGIHAVGEFSVSY